MELNQTTLRGILAQITSVNEAYIVPKQGNWWNPQEQTVQPDTWCAYLIRSNKPRTLPFYNKGKNGTTTVNGVAVEKIATIDLQFVGPQAEDIAENVAFWPFRADVAAAFKTVQGALLPDDLDAKAVNFYQDGQNNILSWNVTIRVAWYSIIDTNQGTMPQVQLNGNIK